MSGRISEPGNGKRDGDVDEQKYLALQYERRNELQNLVVIKHEGAEVRPEVRDEVRDVSKE